MSSVRQHSKTLMSAVVTVILLVILYAGGWLKPLEHWLGVAVQPGFHIFYSLLDTLSPLYASTDSSLLAENITLKDTLAKVARENHDLQTQISQYQEYKEQLEFARGQNYSIAPAKIISRVGQSDVNQIILINQGSSQGIGVGYPVIYGTGILLGTVTTVHDTYSEVSLLTNEASQIQGMVQAVGTDTSGIIRGQFGTALVVEYILKDQPIQAGDMIVTNGQDRFIPSGLVIGTVQTVSEIPSDVYKSATLTPLLRYGNNAIVSVILPKL